MLGSRDHEGKMARKQFVYALVLYMQMPEYSLC